MRKVKNEEMLIGCTFKPEINKNANATPKVYQPRKSPKAKQATEILSRNFKGITGMKTAGATSRGRISQK